jgi:hypothetical protein
MNLQRNISKNIGNFWKSGPGLVGLGLLYLYTKYESPRLSGS